MSGNFTRNINIELYLANGGDYELLERSAYFAEVRYPRVRRWTCGDRLVGNGGFVA